MTPLGPPPALPLPDVRREAIRRQLVNVVSRRRSRRTIAIATGAVVVAAGTSAGAIAYASRSVPVTDKGEARCYTEASLAGGNDFTTVAQLVPGKPGPASIADAISVCSALWRQGFLVPGGQGRAQNPDTSVSHPVPQLTACVMPGGAAAVFPGPPGICQALALPNATP